MKLKLIFLLIVSYVFAQQEDTFSYKYQIIYKYTYKYDSLDLSKTRSENMLLKVGDSISTFMSSANSRRDSTLLATKGSTNNLSAQAFLNGLNLTDYHTKINYKIIKNYPNKNHLYHNERVYKDSYFYIEEMPKDWVISNEKDSINGIKVQKATMDFKGRKWIAYYTEDIPISDGPYKFAGLPGLIVKLYDSEHLFDFELNDITQKLGTETIFLETSRQRNKVNREEFIIIKNNYRKNPQESLERISKEHHHRVKANINSDNIFLEKD